MRTVYLICVLLITVCAARDTTELEKNVQELFRTLLKFPSQNRSTEEKFMETDHEVEQFKFAPGPVSPQCLGCICKLESGCRPLGCSEDVGSLSCGYFQIKQNYWIDCGKPGKDLESCGKDIECSSRCVQNYMKRYAAKYNCPLTCEGYAREHNGGPRGCKSSSTLQYWERLQKIPGCKNPKMPWML